MRPRDWRRRARWLSVPLASAALLGTSVAIMTVGASPITPKFAAGVELTPPTNVGTNPGAALEGISCSSAGNCTAAGGYEDSSGHEQAMATTESGGSFAAATEVTPPANANTNPKAYLEGISCSSAGNCTAVGEYDDSSNHGQAMATIETGGSFATATEVTPPANANTNPSAFLLGISCSSAGNCTAVGRYVDTSDH
jgi:hypothetical protein